MATSISSAGISMLVDVFGHVPTAFGPGSDVVSVDSAFAGSLPFIVEHSGGTCDTLVLSQPSRLFELSISNVSQQVVFFKLFNADRIPSIGSDRPILTLQIASGAFSVVEFGRVGKLLDLGIAYVITGTMDPDDSTPTEKWVQVSMTLIPVS